MSEEEDMYKDTHEGFLIPDESGSNYPDSYIAAESLISTTEVEIVNDDESVTSISGEEEADMFPEGEIFIQDINDVIGMLPEYKDDEVLSSAKSRTKRENSGAVIDRLMMFF